MTIRAMNALLLAGKPLVAIVLLDGRDEQVRLTWTRTRHGQREGKVMGAGRWAPLRFVWTPR